MPISLAAGGRRSQPLAAAGARRRPRSTSSPLLSSTMALASSQSLDALCPPAQSTMESIRALPASRASMLACQDAGLWCGRQREQSYSTTARLMSSPAASSPSRAVWTHVPSTMTQTPLKIATPGAFCREKVACYPLQPRCNPRPVKARPVTWSPFLTARTLSTARHWR